jgi:PAS domain S-box-containing protein
MLTRAVRDELSARRDAEAAHAAVAKERDAQAAMLHLVIQSSPALIYVKDLEGRYVMVNEAFERALGRTEAEVIGRTDAELDPALDALWAANDRLALEGLYHLEETFDGPRGRRIHEGVKFPLHDASGTLYAVCGVSLDVTEQRNAITVTAQARDAALAANAAKSAFLATMSHEIRTPMNAVIGMTDLLEQTELDPQQHEFVTTVRSSGEALLAIINDILDFSKIESGEMDLERAPFVLRDEVEGCLDLVARQASAKGLDLLADIADGCPTRVVGDATRLRQILTNLLANAVKFTEHGQVLVEVRCTDGGRDRVRIVLSVTDTGIGISEEDRGRLFRSFSQIDASTTRVYGGTGLGLVISRRLAEAMNGSITVEDNPAGQGSRFTVEVTLGRCADTEGLHGRADLAAPVLAGRSVLLVDDNPTNLRILELQVTRLGMSCASATSGERALELVRGGLAYDVAILDMRMNDMDGVELGDSLKQLPGRSAAAPLILLTSIGYTRSDSEHSFAALLTKPVKSISLRDTLTVVLGGRSIAWSEHAEAADDGHAAARRVLLAEDNVVNQRVVQLMLTNLGHSVEVVADGVEAVRAVETNDYDVVLMDVQMPRMDGLEATRRIRTTVPSSRQPHIVALTASALVEDREACAAAGMEAYLTKPVRRRELQEMLDRTTSSGTVPAR